MASVGLVHYFFELANVLNKNNEFHCFLEVRDDLDQAYVVFENSLGVGLSVLCTLVEIQHHSES